MLLWYQIIFGTSTLLLEEKLCEFTDTWVLLEQYLCMYMIAVL